MIEITISNQIKLTNLPLKIKNHIKQSLRIPNPTYHKIVSLTRSRFAAQEYYKYYEETKQGELLIPRSFKSRLLTFLEKINLPYTIKEDLISSPNTFKFKGKLELRPYQIPIIEETLKFHEGIISMSTGSGKTIVAVELTKRLNLTTTIIVPNTILLNQFVEEFERHYNFTPGIVGDKRKTIKPITITTFQSLHTDPLLLGTLSNQTSVLIVDECQGAISKERLKLLKKFRPTYLFGLTATPFRSKDDGRTNAISFMFGNIIAEYESPQMKPEVHTIATHVDIPVDDYPVLIENLINHPSRNRLIAGLAIGEAVSGRRVLVLVKRIDHYKALLPLLPPSNNILYIESSDPHRNDLLRRLKNNEQPFQILLGTTSLLATGTDIPSLDTLIIACDIKSEVLTIQGSGRILRLFQDKLNPKIIDLWDNKNFILSRQFWSRKEVYLQKGWKII